MFCFSGEKNIAQNAKIQELFWRTRTVKHKARCPSLRPDDLEARWDDT